MIDYTKLKKKLVPDKDGEPPLHLRVGTVTAVNGDGTVDLLLSGVTVPDVPRLAGSLARVGEVVQVLSFRGSLLVLGSSSTGDSPSPSQRIATTVITTNSATFTTATTQVASVTASLVAGSIYRIVFDAAFDTTVLGDMVRAKIITDNTSGTQLQARDTGEMSASGLVTGIRLEAEYTATVTGNKTFVGTGERDEGTGNIILSAHATFPTYLYVDYVRDS